MDLGYRQALVPLMYSTIPPDPLYVLFTTPSRPDRPWGVVVDGGGSEEPHSTRVLAPADTPLLEVLWQACLHDPDCRGVVAAFKRRNSAQYTLDANDALALDLTPFWERWRAHERARVLEDALPPTPSGLPPGRPRL